MPEPDLLIQCGPQCGGALVAARHEIEVVSSPRGRRAGPNDHRGDVLSLEDQQDFEKPTRVAAQVGTGPSLRTEAHDFLILRNRLAAPGAGARQRRSDSQILALVRFHDWMTPCPTKTLNPIRKRLEERRDDRGQPDRFPRTGESRR